VTYLLSHRKTKAELSEITAYLAEKFTRKGSSRAETSIDGGVIGNQVCMATHQSKLRLVESYHKEADNKLVLQSAWSRRFIRW